MANAGSQVFGSLGLLVVVLVDGPLWLLLPSFFLNGVGGGTPVFMADLDEGRILPFRLAPHLLQNCAIQGNSCEWPQSARSAE
jgi:hypothetical protein